MKKLKIYLLMALAIIIQTTVINKFEIFGVFPNLMLVLVFVFSLFLDQFDAVVYGFVCGVALDFLTGKIIGLNAILITYIALLISYIGKKFVYGNIVSVFLISLLMTVLYQALYIFLHYVIWKNGTFLSALPTIALEALYNSIIATVGYYLVLRNVKKTVK